MQVALVTFGRALALIAVRQTGVAFVTLSSLQKVSLVAFQASVFSIALHTYWVFALIVARFASLISS